MCSALFSEHTALCPEELKTETERDKMEKNEDLEIGRKAFEIDRERNRARERLKEGEKNAETKTFSHQIIKQGHLQSTSGAYKTTSSSFLVFFHSCHKYFLIFALSFVFGKILLFFPL